MNTASLQQDVSVREEMTALQAFIQHINQEPMVIASEYIRYWRAKSTYRQQGDQELKVRHTFFVNAYCTVAGFCIPMNIVITKCLMKLGSQPKVGAPPRNTQERKVQNSLEKMLASRRHRKG